MSLDLAQKTDYCYREYVRLSAQADALIQSTFDDFKLFGVVGATIVLWKPIADLIAPINSKFDPSFILFLGFLSLFSIIGIITCVSLLKHAYAWYFVHNLQAYELVLKERLGEVETSRLFNFNLGKEDSKFISAVYRTAFKFLLIIFASVMVVLPFIVLIFSSISYAIIYLIFSTSSSILYLQIFKRMLKQYSNKNYL